MNYFVKLKIEIFKKGLANKAVFQCSYSVFQCSHQKSVVSLKFSNFHLEEKL